jgi:hypothetical protein
MKRSSIHHTPVATLAKRAWALCGNALLVLALSAAAAQAQVTGTPTGLPSFAELEAAGARFGQIRILAQDIFAGPTAFTSRPGLV